jgi:hypothetical protein
MGASGWYYFVPYEDDIQRALASLRAEYFKQGVYSVRPAFDPELTPFEDLLPRHASEEEREALWEQYQVWSQEKQPEVFATIDDLLTWNGPEGTHSILDVGTVMPEPRRHGVNTQNPDFYRYSVPGMFEESAFGCIYPLSREQLIELFGTAQPAHGMVDGAHDRMLDSVDRGSGIYIIVYQAGTPVEIFFGGISGD